MGYDLSLHDPVTREHLQAEAPHQIRGSTYALGGTRALCLSITSNYASFLYRVLDPLTGKEGGVKSFDGMTGAETLPILKQAITSLSDDVDDNYWKSTEGNTKQALYSTLALAQMRPDGVWKVSC